MPEWHYRLQPDIGVTVRAKKTPGLLSRILGEEAAQAGPPSLELDLAPRGRTEPSGPLSLDPASRALTVRGVHKVIPWSCRIAPAPERAWAVAFSSVLFREYLALHMALLPALQRLLLDRGTALILGAAFASSSGVTILAGTTGRGKTSLLLGALEQGARLVGDEYLGLSEGGNATPIVRALALRRATLQLAPKAYSRLSVRQRLGLRAAQAASAVTRGRIQPLSYVAPSQIGVEIAAADDTPVKRFFWLDAAAAGSAVRCEPTTIADAAEQLAMMQAVHDLVFADVGPFLDAAAGRAPGDHGMRWRKTVERGLQGVACYRLSYPREGLSEALRQVLSLDS